MATIAELAKQGINRMRLPHWRIPEDYIRIDLFNGGHGPWSHLYSPHNMVVNGENPVSQLLIGDNSNEWEPYTGEISPDDTGPR